MQEKNYNEELTIVLIGYFAPLMFSPEWFEKVGAINKDDLDYVKSNKNTVVTPAITFFETDSIKLRIEENRFTLSSKQTPFAVFVEVLRKAFFGLDSLTINAFGLNYFSTLKFDEKQYEKFGNKICPKKYWSCFYDNSFENKDFKSGLSSLTLTTKTKSGIYNLTVQSSKMRKFCVDFNSNFHNQKDNNEKYNVSEVISFIFENYRNFEKKHIEVIDNVSDSVLKNEK